MELRQLTCPHHCRSNQCYLSATRGLGGPCLTACPAWLTSLEKREARKKDRHKKPGEDRHKTPRTGDRHKPTEARKKDRHKPGRKKAKSNKPRTPWKGHFVALDGEGWEGKYTLLSCSELTYDAYNPDGLSTLECLDYLADEHLSGRNAFVGYGLSYDFENILRDVPDLDYIRLLLGEKIEFGDYTISYIPRKILEFSYIASYRNKATGKPVRRTVFIQDVLGFFQNTFEGALKKWGIKVPAIITKGKALRGDFHKAPLEFIKEYNRTELDLLVELMEKLREAHIKACDKINIAPNHTPRTWYGPGAWASNFLNQTRYLEEHPDFTGPAFEELQELVSETVKDFPFASAFYGGRIEAAALGEYEGDLWDYDINSAYPYAIAKLPKWEPGDLVKVEGYDLDNRIGMYLVDWDLYPDPPNFCPFPFRSQGGNVFFPPRGSGWYMSCEVAAALAVFGPEKVNVICGFVLAGTQGGGDGLGTVPREKLCTTALKMDEMAIVRLASKAAGESDENALKLGMNSTYGKTIQQVGSHKYLNPFIASWITSICRSIIMRTIGNDKDKNIISIMTDGILTKAPLEVPLGKNLGQFDETKFTRLIQFMPGVYWLKNGDTGKVVSRYRGMSKNFDPQQAARVLHHPTENLPINMRIFVTRSLALHQPNKYGNKRYLFLEVCKQEKFSLGSKRATSDNFRLRPGEGLRFFPPKSPNALEAVLGSKAYELDLGPAELPYDTARTEEEMLAANRIGGILEQELVN